MWNGERNRISKQYDFVGEILNKGIKKKQPPFFRTQVSFFFEQQTLSVGEGEW